MEKTVEAQGPVDVTVRLAELEAENERLRQDLAWARDTNDFDAKRLRRLALLCGVAVPESNESLLGCAGTVLGQATGVIERYFTGNAVELLRQAFDALDATGDSDIDYFDDEDEEAEAAPMQFAARKIMAAIQLLTPNV